MEVLSINIHKFNVIDSQIILFIKVFGLESNKNDVLDNLFCEKIMNDIFFFKSPFYYDF